MNDKPTVTPADAVDLQSAKALGPTRADVACIPGVAFRDEANGNYTANISGVKAMHAFKEMTEQRRRAELEVGQRINGRVPDIVVRTPDGRLMPVKASDEDQVGHALGALKVGRWGRPTKKYQNGRWWERRGNDWVPEGGEVTE